MARPTKNDIDSGVQGWDGKIDDNFDIVLNGPLPLHEHVGDETDLEVTFPAALFARCFVLVNHTLFGWVNYFSTGVVWEVDDPLTRAYVEETATHSQDITDQFVHYTGPGTVDFDLLPAADWAGHTVTLRNDKPSGNLNIDPNGSETINNTGAGVPFVLPSGQTACIYSNGLEVFISTQS